jgi:hypothetical protein
MTLGYEHNEIAEIMRSIEFVPVVQGIEVAHVAKKLKHEKNHLRQL